MNREQVWCSLARTISICRAGAAIRRELPTSHKPVRFLRPPLRGTARRGRRALRSVDCTLAVGRDHWARRCRNCQICTNLFVFTVRRCAERMGHAPSLQPQTKILCQAGVCPHRGTANKNPRGASPARVFAPNAQFSLRFGIEWHETAKGEFYGHL